MRTESQVDPRLVLDNTGTDQLIAGIASMLFRHIAEVQEDQGVRRRGSFQFDAGRSTSQVRTLAAADFDEEIFLEKQECFCKRLCDLPYLFRRKVPQVSVDVIFSLLKRVAAISQFRKELAVLGTIYVERLLSSNSGVRLTNSNWRPILVAALHLASKTWEDVHPWNAEFRAYMRVACAVDYPAKSLYLLESRFLSAIGYRVNVTGELYAAYLFSIREATNDPKSTSAGKKESAEPLTVRRAVSLAVDDGKLLELQHTEREAEGFSESPRSFTKGGDRRLEQTNPYIGSFRHAPCAAAPSRHMYPRASSSSTSLSKMSKISESTSARDLRDF